MNQKQFDLSWISHAFVMTCSRELQSCVCFCEQRNLLLLTVSLSWWCEALWRFGQSTALSPVLTTGDTFKGNQTPLFSGSCVLVLKALLPAWWWKAALIQYFSFAFHHPDCIFGYALVFYVIHFSINTSFVLTCLILSFGSSPSDDQ